MTEQTAAAWDAEASTFDRPADHGLTEPLVRAAWTGLLRRLLPTPPARVADLGCGTGSLSLLVAGLGHRVDGVDFSVQMLRIADVKAGNDPHVTFRLGDASRPPLTTAHYDVVLVRHVLWALPDPRAALRAWIRLLRPGGRIVLVEGWWSTGAGLTSAQTTALLRDVGLEPSTELLSDPDFWGDPVTDERYVAAASLGRDLNRQRDSEADGHGG